MTQKRKKIGLIGSGNIGGILGLLTGLEALGDVVFFDISDGVAKGKGIDIEALAPVMSLNFGVSGGSDPSLLSDCDVVIITAGVPRKPGMSRDDLVGVNAKVVKSIAQNVATYCPNAFVICITNPLDVMVGLFQKESGLPSNMVVGMAGVLDSARFRAFLADALGVAPSAVHAFVLGGHGDSMVPVVKYANVGGIPLTEIVEMGWLSQAKLDEIIERTRNGGAEVVGLMGTSAYFAPAASGIAMAKAFLRDEKQIMPCAAYLSGEYGVENLYVGVPVVIGSGGVERVIELDLEAQEKNLFHQSVEHVQDLVSVLNRLIDAGEV